MKISHKVTLGGLAIGAGAVVVSVGIAIAGPTGAATADVHAGQFSAVGPLRVLDTRHGIGAPTAPVGPRRPASSATTPPGASGMTRLGGAPGGPSGHVTTPHFLPHGG